MSKHLYPTAVPLGFDPWAKAVLHPDTYTVIRTVPGWLRLSFEAFGNRNKPTVSDPMEKGRPTVRTPRGGWRKLAA